MSKKPMTWMDVIKEQLAKMRKEGKSPSIGDVTPAAKKEWAEIKSGKHPLYMQGSSKGKSKSSKGSKTQKASKASAMSKASATSSNSGMDHQYCFEQMLKKVHLCKKDVSKIHKYLKTMKVQKGGDCGCSQSGGGSCSSCQEGGKGKKGRRTMKVKKGKKGMKAKHMKGGYVSIVDKETGEYDGTEETDAKNEEVDHNES
jgi:hypothetical protein